MPFEDYDYYRARASEERDHAAAAKDQSVASIHLNLAAKYAALAKAEAGPTLRSGWDNSPTAQTA